MAKAHTQRWTDDGRPPLHVHIEASKPSGSSASATPAMPNAAAPPSNGQGPAATDSAMAPWLPRLDALEQEAASRWG